MARKIRMQVKNSKTLRDVTDEYIVECIARNLREGTIKHYRDGFKQIFKYIPEDMLIEDFTIDEWNAYKIKLSTNEDMRCI